MADDRTTDGKMTIPPLSMGPHCPRYALFVMANERGPTLFTLPDDGEVTIGRSPRCTLSIDDDQLSRVHAIVQRQNNTFEVRDCDSRNGTTVRDVRLTPHVPCALTIGDVIRVGGTDLILQYAAGGARPIRLWSHGYFEARLEDECARSADNGRPFAIARIRVREGADIPFVEETLALALRSGDMLASYASRDYELLIVERNRSEATAATKEIAARLKTRSEEANISLACYPSDGRTAEALIANLADGGPVLSFEDDGAVVRAGVLAQLEPLIEKIAAGTISVLVLGETGVGKDVVARMLHQRSPRAKRPLVCLNCASLSESLLESELFGHEKGAFTGALAARVGLLEAASGGTVFLDEVGEMPLSLQAKLLRVLEQREVLRVGAVTPRAIDVRFVAATNRDLEEEVTRKRFRQDLYYRLNGFTLVVPPLRNRTMEIEPLAHHFLRHACIAAGRKPLEFSAAAVRVLVGYEWPGNIRELKNVIDRAVLLASGRRIQPEHLPLEKMGRAITARESVPPAAIRSPPLDEPVTRVLRNGPAREPLARSTDSANAPRTAGEDERARIVAALERCVWNQTAAAKDLGIARQTLITKMNAYNLPRPRKKG